jgi:hypothetical protein
MIKWGIDLCDNDADVVREEYRGHLCIAIFHGRGHQRSVLPVTYWCGYVVVPKNWRGKTRFQDMQVYGGVTFIGSIRFVDEDDRIEQAVGFDCAHAGSTLEECDINFVMAECRGLVDQLIMYGGFGE